LELQVRIRCSPGVRMKKQWWRETDTSQAGHDVRPLLRQAGNCGCKSVRPCVLRVAEVGGGCAGGELTTNKAT
jgi:hypothetical protein